MISKYLVVAGGCDQLVEGGWLPGGLSSPALGLAHRTPHSQVSEDMRFEENVPETYFIPGLFDYLVSYQEAGATALYMDLLAKEK